ncbi:MAG: GNAT family N-acetyltransferase [Flavobacteriales bacterium]|nr:GNAT family N-acetyltransferase [Flavobacteriales bacterium]
MNISWHSKRFNDLTNIELYNILALRTEVFVVEQNCPYQECDGNDEVAIHFYGMADNKIVAYARVLPARVNYETCSIGRVVTSPSIRGKGIGYELMTKAIDCCTNSFGESNITISAQEHLEKYYGKLGFIKASEMYLEDDIPHIKMIRS